MEYQIAKLIFNCSFLTYHIPKFNSTTTMATANSSHSKLLSSSIGLDQKFSIKIQIMIKLLIISNLFIIALACVRKIHQKFSETVWNKIIFLEWLQDQFELLGKLQKEQRRYEDQIQFKCHAGQGLRLNIKRLYLGTCGFQSSINETNCEKRQNFYFQWNLRHVQ